MTSAEDTAELVRTVRRFLKQRGSEAAVRGLMEKPSRYDPAVWKQMAGQLGLLGLTIPEAYDGSGYGMTEIFPVFEEMGRSLLPSPFLSTAALGHPGTAREPRPRGHEGLSAGYRCGHDHRHLGNRRG